jgi:muconolactone delta-isomerase
MQCLAIIRRLTETYSDAQFAPLLEPEAEAVRALYAQGKIRAIWSRDDKLGASILFEVNSLDEARALIETFPLMQRDMLEVEMLIPLRGYRGFGPRN